MKLLRESKIDLKISFMPDEDRLQALKEGNWQKILQQDGDRDWQAVSDEIFKDKRVSFPGLPREVSDTGYICLQLALRGELSPSAKLLLQKELTAQLDTYQRFCQVWVQPAPNPEELLAVWDSVCESSARWEIFYDLWERLGNVQDAMQYAFSEYHYENVTFRRDDARATFLKLLVADHQEVIFNKDPKNEAWLEGNTLHYRESFIRLQPTHANLLDALMNGEKLTVAELLKAGFGKKAAEENERKHLSRRISELNKLLVNVWDNPPGGQKNWIVRNDRGQWASYQLKRP